MGRSAAGPEQMMAAVVSGYGPPDVVRIAEVAKRRPGVKELTSPVPVSGLPAQGATDLTQGALELLDDYRQQTLPGARTF